MDTDTPRPRTKKLLAVGGASLVGILVFAVLHNVFEGVSHLVEIALVQTLFEALSAISFLLALFVCPAVAVFSLVWAALDRWTRPKGWPRMVLLIVPIGVAVVAVWMFTASLSLWEVQRDPAAGFNGGFEAVKSGYPVNWHVAHKPLGEGAATMSFDEVDRKEGDRSLRFDVSQETPGNWRSPGVFQTVSAMEGAYRIAFWMKCDRSQVRLELNTYEIETRNTSHRVPRTLTPDAGEEVEWKCHEYDYTVPEHHAEIRFQMNMLTPGTVWLDDVRITSVSGPERAPVPLSLR